MNEPNSEAAQNTQAPRRQLKTYSAAQKAEWVEKYQRSGLSLREFSSQAGLEYMSLYRWARKQRGTSNSAPKSMSRVVDFAELKLPAGTQRTDWAVELTLPNGTVLRMTKETPPTIVEQVLRVC